MFGEQNQKFEFFFDDMPDCQEVKLKYCALQSPDFDQSNPLGLNYPSPLPQSQQQINEADLHLFKNNNIEVQGGEVSLGNIKDGIDLPHYKTKSTVNPHESSAIEESAQVSSDRGRSDPRSEESINNSIEEQKPKDPTNNIIQDEQSEAEPQIGRKMYNKQQFKNVATNCLKCCMKKFSMKVYAKVVKKFLSDDTNFKKTIEFYREMKNWSVGLGDFYEMTNFYEGTEEQKGRKRCFSKFCQWFLRQKYPTYLLKHGGVSINNQILYLKGKNRLLYINQLTKHGKNKLQESRSNKRRKGISKKEILNIQQGNQG